ncbi:DDE-type integrase/transposase/recombinase [Variovorax saccharolyticus]|uniref:DDE-type integrase/transposase/recombinase n=1 Tax=Variovorax saccharolyticus TaxID=3053516 RepID=UPI004037B161
MTLPRSHVQAARPHFREGGAAIDEARAADRFRDEEAPLQFLHAGDQPCTGKGLFDRDFHAAAGNVKWLTDIAAFQLPGAKVYLSPMIDCFEGKVVSWSIGTRSDAELVKRHVGCGDREGDRQRQSAGCHSDRGAHYRCLAGQCGSAMPS